jgi:hypothetical protein
MNRIILINHKFIKTIQNDEVINSVSTIIRNVGIKCFNPYDLSKTFSSFQLHMLNHWLGKALKVPANNIHEIFDKVSVSKVK